jgi:Leucine-rich repeat (LRR) protein
MTPSNRLRRWFRYCLWSFVTFVLVAATAMSVYYGRLTAEARRQQNAAETIQKLGGIVSWSDPSSPAWLRKIFGDEVFQHVNRVDLEGLPVGDDALGPLAELNQITGLYLGNTRITDAGAAKLADLRQLEDLDLSATKITDAGLANLRGLNRLRCLSLWGTQITDAGLENLSNLKQLESLDLRQTRINGTGLEKLKPLTQLEELDLGGSEISDSALEPLAGMTQLHDLDLGGTKITDAGLIHLRGLTQLERLDLSGGSVADASMERLMGLPQLKELRLQGDFSDFAGRLSQSLTNLHRLNIDDLQATKMFTMKKTGGHWELVIPIERNSPWESRNLKPHVYVSTTLTR